MKRDFEKFDEFNKILEAENVNNSESKLLPIERLAILFDDGKFKELFKYSSVSSFAESFKDGISCAFGNVNGRPLVAYATDFSFEGGSIGVHQSNQILELYRLAKNHCIPIVALIESGGAKLMDTIHVQESLAGVLREAVFSSGFIPQITCTFGHCIGASAFISVLTDFVIMEKDSNLSISGANVNKAATGEDVTQAEIGGSAIHTKHSGSAHFVTSGEENTIKKVRELLSWLPQNNKEKPPIKEYIETEEREINEILDLLPDDEMKPFDVKKLIKLFTDDNEFFEIQEDYAKNLVVGFARFNGIPVGIVANQSLYMGGALDTKSFRKAIRFINTLSAYNFPMLNFADVPGAVPTSDEHKKGILNLGASFLQALGHHKNLKLSIIVRKCFGGAYSMINPKISGGDIIYAYPNASIGIMSDKAMSSVLGKNSVIREKIDTLNEKNLKLTHPVFAVSGAYIDDIIEPKNTRIEIINVLKSFNTKAFNDIPEKTLYNFTL